MAQEPLVPFTVYFPQALLAEAATVALETYQPQYPDTPLEGYQAIALMLRDQLRDAMRIKRIIVARDTAVAQATTQADADLAALDALTITPVASGEAP
jgi:hypothetical protein